LNSLNQILWPEIARSHLMSLWLTELWKGMWSEKERSEIVLIGFSVHLSHKHALPPAPVAIWAAQRFHHRWAGCCHARSSTNLPYTQAPQILHSPSLLLTSALIALPQTSPHFNGHHYFEHRTMLGICPWNKVKDCSTLNLIKTYKATLKTCDSRDVQVILV
jgi:hypothetical protein